MITLLDFRSLYPSMMININAFSPTDIGWNGCGVYPSEYVNEDDGIKGNYSKKQGVVEKTILDLYEKRMKTPKTDPKNLAIKILINCCYGLLGSPKFKSIYNSVGASDVTATGRRSIKHARTVLKNYGYDVIYSDTDSVFVLDKLNNKERLMDIIKYINETQKKDFNIPFPHHGLVLEAIIKRMYFFRDNSGNFIKKHYIYVTDKDEIVVKGISVKRGNCSKVSKLFFEEVIKPKILKNKYSPYEPEVLLKELKAFTKGKEDLLQKRYRVREPNDYKIKDGKDEADGLGYQIAKKYGGGEHWLVINKRIGVGKKNKYTTIKELREKYKDRWIDQICFEVYLRELSEFIIWNKRNNLSKVDRKRIK